MINKQTAGAAKSSLSLHHRLYFQHGIYHCSGYCHSNSLCLKMHPPRIWILARRKLSRPATLRASWEQLLPLSITTALIALLYTPVTSHKGSNFWCCTTLRTEVHCTLSYVRAITDASKSAGGIILQFLAPMQVRRGIGDCYLTGHSLLQVP